MAALSPEQVFDAIAIRVDGPRAAELDLTIGVVLADDGTSHRLELRNGVLVQHLAPVDGAALVIRTTRAALPGLLTGSLEGIALEGDATVLQRLMGVLEAPDPDFAIVTP
jgi:alkyl sulfatase BDS1-like metallo-beta-lactamase superfamily hydrolase